MLMEAYRYRMVDLDYRMHQLAYLSFSAQAKKKSGKYGEKPVYKTFRDFYNYEKELAKIRENPEGDERFQGISSLPQFQKG